MSSMTSTTSSSSSTTRKRTIVPLLLESFPVPPSHIPPSLHTPSSATFSSISGNPPPSLPPSTPLPPLPGPSPISQNETLLFLTSSRSSKISLASINSSPSRPNSIASIASIGHGTIPNAPTGSTTATLGRHHSRRESVASVRSARSNASYHIPNYSRSPSFAENFSYSISEEDPTDLTRVDISQSTAISPMPLSDIDDNDNEKVLDLIHAAHQFGPPFPPAANDSIASLDMQDLPVDDGDGDINSTSYSHAQALHLRMRASRSKSETHKQKLRSRSNNGPANASLPPSESLPLVSKTPKYQPKVLEELTRAVSPDIKTIISATPRPRKSFSGLLTGSSTSADSRSRPRKASDTTGVALGRTVSVRSGSPYELMYAKDGVERWEDDSFVSDYGVPIDKSGYNGQDGLEPDLEARLERQLEGDGSDSDSSLDLHTPLPHLMLRHGLLSPNSKLLPQAPEPPQPVLSDGRPGSVAPASVSTLSTLSKSGVIKDERDTLKRRTRHRDGGLLRGGIGLTTGLGWSDSEDEDAPSALTRRISSLNLSRRSSASSIQSSPLPLTRSSSSGVVLERKTTYDQEWASTSPNARTSHKARSSLPPTSWQKRAVSGRTSTSSAGSTFSLALSIPEGDSLPLHSAPAMTRTTSESSVPGDTRDVRTPSTASSLSIPLPVTPEGPDISPPMPQTEKVLPPLPRPTLRTYPSSLGLGAGGRPSVPRPRTYSSASSVSSAGRSSPWTSPPQSTHTSTPSTPNTYTYTPSTPRPLQLTQAKSLRAPPGDRGPKEKAVPVPSVNSDRTRSSDSASRTPVSSAVGPPTFPPSIAKPKPRTGTGMVYRTSTGRIKLPSALPPTSNISNVSLPHTSGPRSIAL